MSGSALTLKHIFVSHKSTDSVLAHSIVKTLKSEMDNVTFFLSEEIEKGDTWRTRIESELRSTDYLLLIYTDSTYDWSWCLYETILFDEVVSRSDTENHKLYCVHYPGTPPPDPLQKLQTVELTNKDLATWLANFYKATDQSGAFRSLEATAFVIGDIIRKSMPKKNATNNLRPSIQVYPAWIAGDKETPNWGQLASIPPKLPLELSNVETDDISALLLGFNRRPDRMNIVDFLKRLDTEGSEANRPWVSGFLEFLQATLEGRIADQKIVFFRSVSGGVLRPIIELITRSEDGIDCTCRVVFVDAFSAPPVENPSSLQLLANGLRLAVRTRLEVLDRYKGKMARECVRINESHDPADELGKLHPLGGRVLEILRTIVLEAEMQGTRIREPPPILFDGQAQRRYEEIRDTFGSLLTELKQVTSREDQQPEGAYLQTEKLLEDLQKINKDYIEIAAPQFLSILNARVGL